MFRTVSYRCRAQVLLAAAGTLICTASANADLLPGYAVGQGANTSALVIDFAFLGQDSYYFEYYYDGPSTAEQMLIDLDAASNLTVDYQFFTFGGSSSMFINGFGFDGNNSFPVFEGANGESWSYFASNDAATFPINWIGQDTGPTDRVLVDGSIDGWMLNISTYNSQSLTPTNSPPTAFTAEQVASVRDQLEVFQVPEPTSAMLLALASTTLISRRRRSI